MTGNSLPLLHRVRIFHAALAVLVFLAFVTAEAGGVHDWLGYGVALAVLFRLVWMTTGLPQLGLMRFYPSFDGLRLGNAVTHPAISKLLLAGIGVLLLLTTVTGIAMDRGRALGIGDPPVAAVRTADRHDDSREQREREEEGMLEELHESAGNLLMLVVLGHVSYLLLFKRPLALFMLFARRPKVRQD